MKNLSFKTKLIAIFSGFAVLALSLCIIGYFVLRQAADLDRETYELQTVPMAQISGIIENILRINGNVDMMLLELDMEGAFEEYHADVKELNTQTTMLLDAFTPHSDKENAIFDEASRIYKNTFMPATLEVFTLIESDNFIQAMDVMNQSEDVADDMFSLFIECREMVDEWSTVNREEHQQFFSTMQIAMIISGAFMFLLWVLFCLFIPKSMSRPVELIEKIAHIISTTGSMRMPDDVWAQKDSVIVKDDEFGRTMRAFMDMIEMFSDRADILEEIAKGDMSMDVKLVSPRDTIGLSLQTLLANFNGLFSEIISSAGQVANASEQMSNESQNMAQGASEQSSIIEELNTTVGEVTGKTSRNAERAKNASRFSNDIRNNARKSSEQMERMVQAVNEINQAADSIGKVIKVIDDIAFQTNILALNAAVEAARAGEQGKGFSIVAVEVRNLASKSAAAASDTTVLISNSIEKAKLGLTIAEETSESLREIVDGIDKSSEIVSDISRSTSEQAIAVEQINSGLEQVSQIVQQNSAIAQESAASSVEMSGQSQHLQKLIERFKIK